MADAAPEKKEKKPALTKRQRHKLAVRKHVRQAAEHNMHNASIRSSLKTAARSFLDAIEAKDVEKATRLYRQCSRQYDKAASKGVIHPNAASRTKARLAQRLQAAGGPAQLPAAAPRASAKTARSAKPAKAERPAKGHASAATAKPKAAPAGSH